MPFIVFQSDEPFDFTPYVEDGTLPMTAEEAEQFRILLYNAWHDAIGDLVSQVPGARFIDEPAQRPLHTPRATSARDRLGS